MAEIRAFRGIRYDPSKVGDLSRVLAPPYDVISPEQREELYARSPYNITRLILPSGGSNAQRDAYARAATNFSRWLEERVLRKDSAPSIYICDQEFEVDGRRLTRRCFIARVRLERFGEGSILPHERTMPGPKADRLKLMQACRANLSQVMALYPDSDGEIAAALREATRSAPDVETSDWMRRKCRLWCCRNEGIIERVRRAMLDRKLYIADGHHRYETTLRYHEMMGGDSQSPTAFVMMACISMNDAGLAILPTHRLVRGVSDERIAGLLERASEKFEVCKAGGAREALARMSAGEGQAFGLGLDRGTSWYVLRLREGVEVDIPERSKAWRELDVTVLHALILKELLGIGLDESAEGGRIEYVSDLRDFISKLESGEFQAGFLLNPTRVSQLQQVAEAGEKMPPKSTYFYPKLVTGLVINDLSESS